MAQYRPDTRDGVRLHRSKRNPIEVNVAIVTTLPQSLRLATSQCRPRDRDPSRIQNGGAPGKFGQAVAGRSNLTGAGRGFKKRSNRELISGNPGESSRYRGLIAVAFQPKLPIAADPP